MIADHEMVHNLQVISGKNKNKQDCFEGEWETYTHNYYNQGFYLDYVSQSDLITNIKYFEMNANSYYPLDIPKFTFTSKWWHFIYRLPRKW